MIRSKRHFYRAWHAGLLGNRPRTWTSIEEIRASGWTQPVGVRTVGVSNGMVRYRVPPAELPAVVASWVGTPTFSEPMPDHLRTIQGEITRNEYGLDFTYSMANDGVGRPMMREAMQHPQRATGLSALMLLRRFVWPSSLDDLFDLLDLYPGHVVEFGVHDYAVGVLPHRNTIIWEVRAY